MKSNAKTSSVVFIFTSTVTLAEVRRLKGSGETQTSDELDRIEHILKS